MTAEMLTLALDISTVRRDESGRCDSGLCPFHLFRSVRQPFFLQDALETSWWWHIFSAG